MANYNLSDGACGNISFKMKLISLFTQNELGSTSPYALSWANTTTSGWSFGVVQYDISALQYARDLFKNILLNAKDASGNYIVEDTDSLTGRIDDAKVADLFQKAQSKNGQGLTSDERALIESALQSTQGMSLIDSSYKTIGDRPRFPARIPQL